MSVATSGIGQSGEQGERLVRNAVLIAGPTASGKSAFALEIARRVGGTIVNADSMQVYAGLRVITARPSAEEMHMVPHLLYGHVPPDVAYSTGQWVRDVRALVESGGLDGRRAVFAGGTGLYFRALLEGLSEMPAIPEPVRDRWRGRLAAEGPGVLHAVLAREDAAAAAAIRPSDGQRVVRALEVLEASGRSILSWQAERGRPVVDPASAVRLVLDPPRETVRERIDRRFDRMIAEGALEEARALARLRLDPGLPAAKAIGLRELQAFLGGELSREEAVARAKAATRRYAKRQATWFRHQLDPSWRRLATEQELGRALAEIAADRPRR